MSTTIQVTERPILFSGEMVRAILDGRKTQTRRVVKPQPPDLGDGTLVFSYREVPEARCPYGQPGDRLWVREAHAIEPDGRVVYRADRCAQHFYEYPIQGWMPLGDPFFLSSDYVAERWRPSIHMPRWASRITLEITDVRVERVQEITPDDVIAEGIDVEAAAQQMGCGAWATGETLRDAFAHLWDSLNGPRGYGWDANPWVWALTFRRVEG